MGLIHITHNSGLYNNIILYFFGPAAGVLNSTYGYGTGAAICAAVSHLINNESMAF
jgi:hypothetical protein